MHGHFHPQRLTVIENRLAGELGGVSRSRLKGALRRFKSPWLDFYWDRIGDLDYRAHVSKAYKPFIDAVDRELAVNETALEVGVGLGTITSLLAHKRPWCNYIALDKCQFMVAEAQKALGATAKVFHGDMRTSTWMRPQVIHGHGVLEHLDDIDIYRTLEAHKTCGARAAVHYVPGEGHVTPSFGDERLLPLDWWVDKWDATAAFTFNEGKDYVLIWRF